MSSFPKNSINSSRIEKPKERFDIGRSKLLRDLKKQSEKPEIDKLTDNFENLAAGDKSRTDALRLLLDDSTEESSSDDSSEESIDESEDNIIFNPEIGSL